jgi:hypothetical protein
LQLKEASAHYATKAPRHYEIQSPEIKNIFLVKFSAFEPLWHKKLQD